MCYTLVLSHVNTLTGHEYWRSHLVRHAGLGGLDGLWGHADAARPHHGVELVVRSVFVGREGIGEQGRGGSQLRGNGGASPGRLVS